MTRDLLQIYLGDDLVLSDKLKVHQPTIGEIASISEERYYSTIHLLTAIPCDFKSPLADMDIDYETLSNLRFFAMMTRGISLEDTRILFGNVDLQKFHLYEKEDGSIIFADQDSGIVIDDAVHMFLSKFICDMHGIKKIPKKAGNKATKKILIEEDRYKRSQAQGKKYEPYLFPLISSMINHPGFKYNIHEVKDMTIFQFMDSVRRVGLINSTDRLAQAYYAGNLDRDKFDTEKLDWMCDLYK